MRCWLITVGEPLPSDGAGDRLLRTGLLAESLRAHGHQVLWWTSAFDHMRKRYRARRSVRLTHVDGYRIHLLPSLGYRHNVSLRRVAEHALMARSLRRAMQGEQPPDVILCSLPTLDLCAAAVDYGRRFRVPVVLDVRDQWPDVFIDLVPPRWEAVARRVLRPWFRLAARVCARAQAIVGLTDEFVDWGVRLANRPRRPADAAFPLAYRSTPPSAANMASASEYWTRHGLGPDHRRFVVVFCGTLGRHFEWDVVVRAARRLATVRPEILFVLCGDGPNLLDLRQATRGDANILLPGWVNAAQIWVLQHRGAVGLAPYRSTRNFVDNLPNKPIEYFSGSLPVVSSLQGNLARLLSREQCGVTYANGCSDELAAVLAVLHDDRGRRQHLADHAGSVFRRRFVAEKVYGEFSTYLAGQAAAPHERMHAA